MPSEGRGILRPIQEQLYAIHRGEPAAACLHQGPCSALLGRRTRRYNPGMRTVAEYVQAVTQRPRGAHGEGGCVIHERPKERRREFAREIWRRRRQRGTDRWTPKSRSEEARPVSPLRA